ncbi:protein TIC 22-like, chloroplastic isoform X2 [Prosopis cineraria]|uniref:protein TIC 22-like, chloroplastic isoform X2 n=1 Tax=Prosopis cineraria TaxID=364024 RepID=UPI00241087A2|nr:protein TIC 22-like, chloroplastic isoform X2 [Prosopis cineraria]
MNSGNSDRPKVFSLSEQPQLLLRNVFADLQWRCSSLAHNLTQLPFLDLRNTLSNLQFHAKHALDAGMTNFCLTCSPGRSPAWASLAQNKTEFRRPVRALSTEAIEERLAGVPVYALSNAAEEFVLVSGTSTGKNLGLFCFKKEDAEALLEQVRSIDPEMRSGSKVVPVALNKVFQLKVDGVAFRLIPESSQVKNALREREKSGFSSNSFSGVPVFQEDLENSLQRASNQQNQLNPIFRPGEIQVAVLEEVIKGMKESSTWEDVVFIPPGFDVSTESSER